MKMQHAYSVIAVRNISQLKYDLITAVHASKDVLRFKLQHQHNGLC